jgi:hypothetical protein
MTQFMDVITQSIGGDTTRQISRQLGADEQTTQTAISAALPLLLTALARNSSNPEGAQSLHSALSQDHDGSILGDLGGLLGNPQASQGAGILKHMLGGRQPVAEQAVSRASGLDTQRTAQLLMMLAPIVMGVLGRQQRQAQLGPSALGASLGSERERLAQKSPDLMGMATQLLDSNHDGSFMDELGGIAGKLFGNKR